MPFIATIGGYLITKFGKDTALAVMFFSSKVILFTLISSFVGTMLSFLTVFYSSVKSIITQIEALATGSSAGTWSPYECADIIFAAVLQNLGFIDAFNIVGPTLLLAYFTYFNAILFGFSIAIYRFINNAVTEFAMVIK